MTKQEERSMAEVVARLRQVSPDAASEVAEFHAAVRELTANSRRMEAALVEIAGEAAAIATAPGAAAADRLRHLAAYTANVRTSGEAHRAALNELLRGLESWGFPRT